MIYVLVLMASFLFVMAVLTGAVILALSNFSGFTLLMLIGAFYLGKTMYPRAHRYLRR